MSKATKKRFVTKQLEMELVLPSETELIAKLGNVRGNHLHEVEDQNGNQYLASMPTKFRHTVWVKRGQFVLLQPIEEGDKVKAEIVHILDADNIKHIQVNEKWPERFEADAEKICKSVKSKEKGDTFIDSDLLPPSESEDEDEEESGEECESGTCEEEENSSH